MVGRIGRQAAASLALREELENEFFTALALLITKLWTIDYFAGQKAFQNEYIGMIKVRYILKYTQSFIHCQCEREREARLGRHSAAGSRPEEEGR